MFRNFNNALCIYRECNAVGIGLSLGSCFLAQVMLFYFVLAMINVSIPRALRSLVRHVSGP